MDRQVKLEDIFYVLTKKERNRLFKNMQKMVGKVQEYLPIGAYLQYTNKKK